MAGPRRKFSREFKLAAIAPVVEGVRSGSDMARELGISHTLVSRWKLEFENASERAFPGKGNVPEGMAELARLQRENERLRAEIEILKKAISIFGKVPQ
jgi:transposase